MKILAKQYGEDLVAVVYNVTVPDLAILDLLIQAENLVSLDAQSESNGLLMVQPAKVVPRIGHMANLFPATLHAINTTDEQVALMIVSNALRYTCVAVNVHRANFDKRITDQQVVYAEKVVQAKRVVEGDETSGINYVQLEADTKGLSVSDAALSILEAAEKHEAMLFKTESIRIRYTKAAYELKTHAELAEFKSRLSAELTG